MEKKTKRVDVDNYYFDWDGDRSINEIKEDLKKLESLGATHISIGVSWDCTYYQAYKEREETEEELKIRLEYEKHQQSIKERKEREQYERLKAKFND